VNLNQRRHILCASKFGASAQRKLQKSVIGVDVPRRADSNCVTRLDRSICRVVHPFLSSHACLLLGTLLTSDSLLFPIQYSILIYIAFDTRALGLSLPLAPSGLPSCTCRHWYTSCVTLLTTRWHAVDTRLTLFYLFAPFTVTNSIRLSPSLGFR
jgi:hypothetical protein